MMGLEIETGAEMMAGVPEKDKQQIYDGYMRFLRVSLLLLCGVLAVLMELLYLYGPLKDW